MMPTGCTTKQACPQSLLNAYMKPNAHCDYFTNSGACAAISGPTACSMLSLKQDGTQTTSTCNPVTNMGNSSGDTCQSNSDCYSGWCDPNGICGRICLQDSECPSINGVSGRCVAVEYHSGTSLDTAIFVNECRVPCTTDQDCSNGPPGSQSCTLMFDILDSTYTTACGEPAGSIQYDQMAGMMPINCQSNLAAMGSNNQVDCSQMCDLGRGNSDCQGNNLGTCGPLTMLPAPFPMSPAYPMMPPGFCQ